MNLSGPTVECPGEGMTREGEVYEFLVGSPELEPITDKA